MHFLKLSAILVYSCFMVTGSFVFGSPLNEALPSIEWLCPTCGPSDPHEQNYFVDCGIFSITDHVGTCAPNPLDDCPCSRNNDPEESGSMESGSMEPGPEHENVSSPEYYVTLYGANITGVTNVLFDNIPATVVSVDQIGAYHSTITVIPPPHDLGTVNVIVLDSGGSAVMTSTPLFYTYIPSAPEISFISPSSGPVTGGNWVIISGKHLSSAKSVYFGHNPATILSNNDESMTVIAPYGSKNDDVSVIVTTDGGFAECNYHYTLSL